MTVKHDFKKPTFTRTNIVNGLNPITLLYIINFAWDSAQCLLTYSTKYFQRLTLESWNSKLEQTFLNRCQQLPAPYIRLTTTKTKPTNGGLLTETVNLAINRRTSNRTIAFNGPDLKHHGLTNNIHLTLKNTSAQVVTNKISFKNYSHPDYHTIRTTQVFSADRLFERSLAKAGV